MTEAPDDPFWLGRALLDCGAITREQLASAKHHWRKDPRESFATVLETLGLAGAERLAELIAGRHELPLARLDAAPLDLAAARLLPKDEARRKCALAYRQIDRSLDVATEDPAAYGLRQARKDFPHFEIRLQVAPRREILDRIDEAWRAPAASAETNAKDLFAALVRDAVAGRATDLHLEPRDQSIDVRQRVDGRLVHRCFIENALREPLIQAAKLAGRMDITERRLPQDGQGSAVIGARRYHLRFSCIPAVNGESVVVRIIDENAGVRSFAEIGLSPPDEERLRAMIALPNGLVTVTGPTGSGKTTLLYSMLHNLPAQRAGGLKIVTLEEPVEVRHPRCLLQIGVDERIGRTFSELLRHVLRHDPDVLLVGETRDRTTAEITLRAALTGRLCFSTLHTSSAVAAVMRLADIGLDPLMLASALKGSVAQRLVRRPCPRCAEPHPRADLLADRYANVLGAAGILPENAHFVSAQAGRDCAICQGSGYHGRTAIAEVCPLGGLERLVADRAPAAAFWERLRERGVRPIFDEGVRKAALGMTTIEEVHASVEEPTP